MNLGIGNYKGNDVIGQIDGEELKDCFFIIDLPDGKGYNVPELIKPRIDLFCYDFATGKRKAIDYKLSDIDELVELEEIGNTFKQIETMFEKKYQIAISEGEHIGTQELEKESVIVTPEHNLEVEKKIII